MNPDMTTWTARPLAAFDIESTLPNPMQARIVTACLHTIHGTVTTPRHWLLDPEVEIPAEASDIHGVTTARARAEGSDYREGYTEIRDHLERSWAEHRVVAIFNARYDLTVLHAEGLRLGFGPLAVGAVVDPFVIDRAMDIYRPGKRTLSALCRHYGIPLGEDAHDAGADALATARLAWKLAHLHPFQIGALTVPELMAAQAVWHRSRQDDYAAYLTRRGEDASDVSGDWPLEMVAAS